MNTWTPIFSKIVDSSLWREDDLTVKIFITMLAKKDSDQIVRASAFMIGEWAKKTEAEALRALKVLSSPDTKRIEKQPHDGRRIQRVEQGWLILNGKEYEDLMRSINRKAYQAEKAKIYRKRGKALPGENSAMSAERNGATPDQVDKIVEDHLPQKGEFLSE